MDAPTRAALIARAAGHPLFLEQLLLNASEATARGLPGSLQAIVLARLDRLPSTEREALQAAAVLGQRFRVDALRHLLGAPHYDPSALIERRLLQAESSDGFLFAHALIRDGAYASMLKARRRALHTLAGEWHIGRDSALAAHHLIEARDRRAPAVCCRAASELAARYLYDDALTWLQRGLAIASEADDRGELQILRASILLDAGHAEDARDAWKSVAASAGDAYERARALVGQAGSERLLGGTAEALALLDRADSLLVGLPATPATALQIARVHHLRGSAHFVLGNADECLMAHDRALRSARQAGSTEAEANALSGLGDAHYMRGRMRSAREHFERSVALARAHGLGRVEVASAYMAAWTAHFDGPLGPVLAQIDSTLEHALQVKHRRSEMIARTGAAVMSAHLGRFDRAFEELDTALATARSLGSTAFESQILAYRCYCLWSAGQIEEARAVAPEAASRCIRSAPLYFGAAALAVLALVTSDAGERERALIEGEAWLTRGALSHNHFDFRACAIDALLACGEFERALAQAEALESYTAAEPLLWSNLAIERARLLVRHRFGDRSQALMEALQGCSDRLGAAGFGMRQGELRNAIGDLTTASRNVS